jgi:hypothetical protein
MGYLMAFTRYLTREGVPKHHVISELIILYGPLGCEFSYLVGRPQLSNDNNALNREGPRPREGVHLITIYLNPFVSAPLSIPPEVNFTITPPPPVRYVKQTATSDRPVVTIEGPLGRK